MRYHLTPVFRKTIDKKCRLGCGKLKAWYTVGRMQNGTATIESSMNVPQKFKNKTINNSAISFLDICRKKNGNVYHKGIIAALLTIAKIKNSLNVHQQRPQIVFLVTP